MSRIEVIGVLALPALLAVGAGCMALRRAFSRQRILPEEISIAVSWVFVVGGLFWLGVYLSGSTFLGFAAPWSWLAAAHFVFAGAGALSVSALSCRTVSHPRAVRILRLLLAVHPVAYLVTAAGIYGVRFCDEIGACCYALLFSTQFGAVLLGRPDRIGWRPRLLLQVALGVPLFTIIPAIAWAWGRPFLGMSGMVAYHGVVNAAGHVGLGLAALAWGRAPAHSGING